MEDFVETFYEKTKRACADRDLAAKLRRATERQAEARRVVCGELGDSARFRDLAAAVRDDALDNLDELLEGFLARIETAGVRVHRAADAAAAGRAVLGVARRAGVLRVAKSKSMITEEIGLNHALEEEGIEVVETDLGEFIIQLLGQHPAHIVIPALHLSAGEVERVFREKIGYRGPGDPESLTRAAREHLRGKFRAADMGLSGVNFALAAEGLWTICTNEGNGRYVTGLPRIYLAVMGMERIVRDGAAGAMILKLLARFATGQRITQYVNVAGGPRLHDGPREVHLVLLDNGRSGILKSKYREMLRCIRCGACLNVCPVFRNIGGQSFPGCYSGPMGSVLLPLQKGFDEAGGTAKACTLCGLCAEVCPVRIPLPDLLVELRGDMAEAGRGPLAERAGMALASFLFRHPLLYRAAQRMMRFGMLPFSRSGWVKWLPSLPGRWTDIKDLPLPAKRSFLSSRVAAATDPTGSKIEHFGEPPPAGEAGKVVTGSRIEHFGAAPPQSPAAAGTSPDPGEARLAAAGLSRGKRIALFTERARSSGAEVHLVKSPGALQAAVGEILAGAARVAVACRVPPEENFGVAAGELPPSSCERIVTSRCEDDDLFALDGAVTDVDAAVAETGSVTVSAGPKERRRISLVPMIHVALVRPEQIVPDLLDWAGSLGGGSGVGGAMGAAGAAAAAGERDGGGGGIGAPAAAAGETETRTGPKSAGGPAGACSGLPPVGGAVLITGPSKTADIEIKLVKGVHGPGELHLVVADYSRP